MSIGKDILDGIVSEVKRLRFHAAGYPFMMGALLVWAVFPSVWLGLGVAWVCYFFRHPYRVISDDPDGVVSPADGRVCDIERNIFAPGIDEVLYHRISVFLSVFDVHVNRLPVGGKIIKRSHRPGVFRHAAHPQAGESNEQLSLHIQKDNHDVVVCVQVAGWIARRIVCDLREGDVGNVGDTYGIIRFGSRMDIYVPASYGVTVKKGQGVRAGESVIAQCLA